MSNITLNILFVVTSSHFHLPAGALESLCWVESGHNPKAIHLDDGGTNSVGICQLKLKTAKWLGFKGSEKELMNPQTNIFYAGAYLSYQYSRYGHRMNKAVIAYNIGNAIGLSTTEYQTKVFNKWRKNKGRVVQCVK